MPTLSTTDAILLHGVQSKLLRGDPTSDDDLSLFMRETKDIAGVLFALGERYVLSATDILRTRERVTVIQEARSRLAVNRRQQ